MTYDFAAVARILADRAGATMHVLRNLRVLVDIERTPNTRDEFSVWLSDLASSLERGLVAQTPSREDALSGLLRGMARRVGEWRRTSAGHYAQLHQAVEDWGRNDEQMLAENQRLANDNARLRLLLARQEDGKPNLWFTKPAAEFPLEIAERADRERVESVSEAHGLANMMNRDPMLMLRRGEWHVEKVRDRKADGFQQHYEAVARLVDGLRKPWPEAEPGKCCWAHAGPDFELDLDAPTVCTRAEEGP